MYSVLQKIVSKQIDRLQLLNYVMTPYTTMINVCFVPLKQALVIPVTCNKVSGSVTHKSENGYLYQWNENDSWHDFLIWRFHVLTML